MSGRVFRCLKTLERGNLGLGRSNHLAQRHYSSIIHRRASSHIQWGLRPDSRTLLAPPSLGPRLPVQSFAVRFASTTPNISSSSAAVPVVEQNAAAPTNDVLADPAEILASVTAPQIEPHIGFLKELGLDFGWGPTAFLEWSLEHVHILLGTPWWATLVITTLALRAVLFNTYIGSSDNSARLLTIQPHVTDIRNRLDQAKQARDMPAMLQTTQELRNLYAASGVKLWKNLLPFTGLFLGYGMFRLTRNMAYLPVPGLDVGGTLWFYDLTASDPYFLLPITTGLATFYLFKLGGETGGMASLSPLVQKSMQWGLPILSTAFMAFWPAAMQVGFASTSIISLIQTWLLKEPWFRNLLGIHPMPTQSPSASQHAVKGMTIPTTARTKQEEPEAPAQGLVASVGSKFQSFVDQNQSRPSNTRSKIQMAQARRYEEKRREEIRREKQEAEQERQRRRYGKKV